MVQEVSHAGGRTDIVADHPCGTYIFELKVNKPPKVAMSQVQRKKYANLIRDFPTVIFPLEPSDKIGYT